MFLASVICYAIHPILCCFAVVGLFYCSGIEPIRKGVQQTQDTTHSYLGQINSNYTPS